MNETSPTHFHIYPQCGIFIDVIHTHTQTPICRFYQWLCAPLPFSPLFAGFMNDIEDMNEKVVEGILCTYKRGVSTTTIIPNLRHFDVTMT